MYTTVMNKGVRSATALLKRCGCVPVKGHYSQGYHFNSGFFYSPQGFLWYWMTDDDRDRVTDGSAPRNFLDTPLIRTAKHLKDYTGGHNNYPKSERELVDMLNRFDENGYERTDEEIAEAKLRRADNG